MPPNNSLERSVKRRELARLARGRNCARSAHLWSHRAAAQLNR